MSALILVAGLAEKYKADFVIIDASPSNDELNKVSLPAAADLTNHM